MRCGSFQASASHRPAGVYTASSAWIRTRPPFLEGPSEGMHVLALGLKPGTGQVITHTQCTGAPRQCGAVSPLGSYGREPVRFIFDYTKLTAIVQHLRSILAVYHNFEAGGLANAARGRLGHPRSLSEVVGIDPCYFRNELRTRSSRSEPLVADLIWMRDAPRSWVCEYARTRSAIRTLTTARSPSAARR